MPTTQTEQIKLTQLQLICPKPCPQRGKSFPLSGNDEWFIYPHGKTVYLYNLKEPKKSREYREHAYNVSVAKLSPSGTLIASADQSGNLRVYDFADLKTNLEAAVLGGRINDLCWSEDEKFIAVSGEGREQFANVVKVDGGASFGELTGPSKPSSSIALTSTHCFLASDDKSLTIYHAAPKYKYMKSLRDHEGFVQVVKCSKDGRMVASAGADGKVFIYSTDTFEVLLSEKLHNSGILAFEWCNNDQSFLTASADKTVKLWSFPAGQLICSSEVSAEWTFDKQICGLKVLGDELVVVLRLDGDLEVRSLESLKSLVNSPLFRSIGHSKGIVHLHTDKHALYSLSYDGSLKTWECKNNTLNCIKESTFNTPMQKLITPQLGIFEDRLKDLSSTEGESVNKYDCKIVGYQGDSTLILADGRIIVDGVISSTLSTSTRIEIAVFSSSGLLAISTGTHMKILSLTDLHEIYTESITAKITAMSFSRDSETLAVADDQRRIKLYSRQDFNSPCYSKISTQWCNHSARIDVLLWTQTFLLSAGVDGCLMAWSAAFSKNGPMAVVRNAHSAPINALIELTDEKIVVSGASDSSIKSWEF